jgi:hypothetical protein
MIQSDLTFTEQTCSACPILEYSNISIRNTRLPIDFLINSDYKRENSGLLEILNEAVPMNKVAQKGNQHQVDFLSVQYVEIRNYNLHYFHVRLADLILGPIKQVLRPIANLRIVQCVWTLRYFIIKVYMSSDSSVSNSDGLRAGRPGLDSRQGQEMFSTAQRLDRIRSPSSLLSNGCQGYFHRGLKRPGREADHSPPSGAEAKNGSAIPQFSHTSSWRDA